MADEIPDPGVIEKNEQMKRGYIESISKPIQPAEAVEAPMPTAAEAEHPVAAETLPPVADENAAVKKGEGAAFPMPSIRPQAPQKIKEEGSVIVAKELAGQMGTAPEIKAQQRIDERKFAVLDDGTLAALSHFSYRFVYDGVRYWGHITEWWLTGSQGLGGLARRHVLQLMANSSGIQSVERAKQPNVIARSLWDRNWKQKAEAEGKVVDD